MPDDLKMYETREGAKAEVKQHQRWWQELYPSTPKVEPIPNIEKVDATFGRIQRRRSSKINEGPLLEDLDPEIELPLAELRHHRRMTELDPTAVIAKLDGLSGKRSFNVRIDRAPMSKATREPKSDALG